MAGLFFMEYRIDDQAFRLNDSDAQCDGIIKRLNKCIKAIEEEGKSTYCKDLSEDTKLLLLDNLEKILFGIRGSIEEEKMNTLLDEIPKAYHSMNVHLDVQKDRLIIQTPLTTVRKMASSYYIASEIIATMRMYEQEHAPFRFFDYMDQPFHAIQIRKIMNGKSLRSIPDNNNEDAHIVNAITVHGFHRSDNVSWMRSFTSKVEFVKTKNEEGMKFIFRKSDPKSNINSYEFQMFICK